MPLHLLGKKSWNVYNTDNIARVRRDEADARAREADEERRRHNDDGETRLTQLRGVDPSDLAGSSHSPGHAQDDSHSHSRKKRRLVGEDDTDRDLRLAHSRATGRRSDKDVQLTDAKGHIDLVQQTPLEGRGATSDAVKEPEEMGIRLSDAAGRKSNAGSPWYNTSSAHHYVQETIGRNVWGNEDAGRRERDQKRVIADDPLATIKKGVRQLRQSEEQRTNWREQREKDLVEVEELARRERKRRRRKHHDIDSLDGFDLDADSIEERDGDERSKLHHKSRHHHHDRRRHRSRSRSPHRRKERHLSHDVPASTK